MEKSVFGLIVTTRGFFNPKIAFEGRKQLTEKLDSMGFEYVILGEEDTKYGCVETVEDAQKCAKLFDENKNKIKGIIVSIPNFGDEVATVNAIKHANLNVPVLVHASDDDLNKMDLEFRRDSFCGKLSICNNLHQYGIKFTNTKQHTSSIMSDSFSEDIENFNRVCLVAYGLKNARIAQIGTRPAAFQTVRYSEKLLQNSGITIIPIDLLDITNIAEKLRADKKVSDKISEMKQYGRIASNIPEETIEKSARLNLAIEKFVRENGCNAGAVQCWSAIEEVYGCAACLPMSMLGEKGIPMACETDIMGAVSMYALYLASGDPAGFLDWNNNYQDDRDKCIVIHCSNFPKSFMGREFEISSLDVLGNAYGHDRCFGACKAQIAPGAATFAKVSTDDMNGVIRAYVGEGEFTDDTVKTPGSPGVIKVPRLQTLLDHLCMNGFEHHVAINRSNSAEVLNEAFGKYMGWDVYKHN